MSNAWDDMRKAKEDSYFDTKNKEALARLAKKKEEEQRLSPVSGEPMVQEVLHGVVIDRCPVSGGVWLDAGELEQLVEVSKKMGEEKESGDWLGDLFKKLSTSPTPESGQ